MKILILSYEYPPIGGGAGRVIQALATQWATQGCELTILTSGLDRERSSQQEGTLTIQRLPAGRRSAFRSNPRQMLRWTWAAWRYLEETAPNFEVVVANFMLPGGWVAYRLQRRWGWPYLILTHGHDVPGAAPEEMRWYHAALGPLLRTIGKHAQGITVLNPDLHSLMTAFLPEQRERIWQLPNGLDRVEIAEKEPGQGPLHLAWAGRLVPQKRPELALRAVAELPFPFRLELFGDGPLRQKLERELKHHPYRDHIRLRGFVAREAWLDSLRKTDLLLHTARFEAMSLVQLEACAQGVYVLSSPVPGTEAWLVPGQNGEFVASGFPGEWGAALNNFYRDRFLPGFRYPPGYAEDLTLRLGWPGIAEQYRKILELISQRPSTR